MVDVKTIYGYADNDTIYSHEVQTGKNQVAIKYQKAGVIFNVTHKHTHIL